MKITSPKLDTSHLTLNDAALRRCEHALELKDKGDYDGAQEAMRPLWQRVGARPETKGLYASVAAEVLLSVGILTGWMASRSEIKEAQEAAKNLITESITYYQSVGDTKRIAAARAEIAYCYWRDGELNEARIMLLEALQMLFGEGETRARALLKLAIVESSASRFRDSLDILRNNARLFKKVSNHTIRGNYHNQFASVLLDLAKSEPSKREDHLQQALSEFERADHHFQLAKNKVFRASVKNNLGLVLFNLSRFRGAHKCIAEARRLAVSLRNRVLAAQFDESRAQVLIAERKFKEAEVVARGAVRVLDKSGQQCLLADALITHGIALAGLGKRDQAQFTFQHAMGVAYQVGALNKAGLAALTLIEEIDGLPPEFADQVYDRATEWLSKSQSQEVALRVIAASKKIRVRVRGELDADAATKNILNTTYDLQKEMSKLEGMRIKQALAKANGSLTRAASLLSMSYQALAYIIEARHKDLLKERSPVHRRSRKKDTQGSALS